MAVDEPVSMGECPACRTLVYRVKAGGLEYTADPSPLDAQTAVYAVLAGRRLYRITFVGGKPSGMRPADNRHLAALRTEPGERPLVVAEHPCAAVSRPLTPTPRPSVQEDPPKPPVGRTAPLSGPQAGPSSVRSAEPRRSDGTLRAPSGSSDAPRCDACGQPCADGTYAAVGLGELVLWAQHVQEGPCTPV